MSGPTPPLGSDDGAYLAARRASMLVSDHLLNAAFDIDGQFGAGYAKAHPELEHSAFRLRHILRF
jgi:hypothetical protein